jgi:hypothetical protein
MKSDRWGLLNLHMDFKGIFAGLNCHTDSAPVPNA